MLSKSGRLFWYGPLWTTRWDAWTYVNFDSCRAAPLSSRQPEPLEEADVYLDALWGPLFFRYERIRRDKGLCSSPVGLSIGESLSVGQPDSAVVHCLEDSWSLHCFIRRNWRLLVQWRMLENFPWQQVALPNKVGVVRMCGLYLQRCQAIHVGLVNSYQR